MTYYEYCDAQAQYCEAQARRFMSDALMWKFWTGAANMFAARLESCSIEKAASPVSEARRRLVLF